MDTLTLIKDLIINREAIGMFTFTFIVLLFLSKDYNSTIKVLRKIFIVYLITKLLLGIN